MCLRNRKKSSKDLTQVLRDASGPLLIHLLFSKASREMVSAGRVAVKKPSLMNGKRDQRLRYENYTRTGLKTQQVFWSYKDEFEMSGSNHHQ